ncbi:zinc ribbon domain-containing protein [Eggerthella sinensis]|uniref:zinc ribbon domain-containing protein n=1 Tax=Eggerthella sinensis TaxID=242230 RepID=UPI00266D57BD|nr:zinc ribbon domain-containing protein [Eggerthella sinensis]
MGLFSMSGRKKHRTDQGSGYYQQQGFMGKLGGFMGSFSSSDRKRYAHQQGYAQQPAQAIPSQRQAAPAATGIGCPKCGAQVPAGSKFCLECGEKLGGGFCSQCGATLPPHAKFCAECGTPRG